ncbi:unnamed protein product [Calypogeia fissa]
MEIQQRLRLKREDHLRVKHDKLFSEWKILVGPADWKDHIAGEEGSQRYRIHNLPASYFGPGVYELGLTRQQQHASKPNTSTPENSKHRKLRRHTVVVVYLGQADNIRQRLQRYGQTGSHLEGTRSRLVSALEETFEQQKSGDARAKFRGWFAAEQKVEKGGGNAEPRTSIQGGLGLFTEVFSRGYSIAFRWARTESKQMAEKVESELLQVFDYPWNTSLNGARRPRDILVKLDLLQQQLESNLCLGPVLVSGWRKWDYFGRKVGISVPVRKPTDTTPARAKISDTFFLSSTKGGRAEDGHLGATSVCGILLPDGSTCGSRPVKGRRRCKDHKGQRAKVSTRQIRTRTPAIQQQQQQQSDDHNPVETGRSSKPAVVIIRAQMQGKRVEITDVSTDGFLVEEVCGAVVGGGAPCLNRPLQGRKRCSTHKGMRTSSKSIHPKAASLVA